MSKWIVHHRVGVGPADAGPTPAVGERRYSAPQRSSNGQRMMAAYDQGWRATLQDPRFNVTAVRLAAASAGIRFVLRDVESRWQMLAFCAGIFAIEFLSIRGSRNLTRALMLSGICAASILTVKLVTEPDVVPLAIWTVRADIKHLHQHVSATLAGHRHL